MERSSFLKRRNRNAYITLELCFRHNFKIKVLAEGITLTAQWSGFSIFTNETGSVPSRGAKIPQVVWPGQKKKVLLDLGTLGLIVPSYTVIQQKKAIDAFLTSDLTEYHRRKCNSKPSLSH